MSQVEGLDAPAIMRIGAARLTAGLDRMPRPGTGPMPRPGPVPHPDQPLPAGDPATGPHAGPSRAARRGSHRAKHTDPSYRDMPGPIGGDEWR